MNKNDVEFKIFNVEEWLNENMEELKSISKKLDYEYKSKYIDILFDFYNSAYNFSCYYDCCEKETYEEYNRFINNFSRLIQFYEFTNIKHADIWVYFNNWKKERDSIKEYSCTEIDKYYLFE